MNFVLNWNKWFKNDKTHCKIAYDLGKVFKMACNLNAFLIRFAYFHVINCQFTHTKRYWKYSLVSLIPLNCVYIDANCESSVSFAMVTTQCIRCVRLTFISAVVSRSFKTPNTIFVELVWISVWLFKMLYDSSSSSTMHIALEGVKDAKR